MIELINCSTDSDFSQGKIITNAYMDWLNLDLSFQNVDKEMQNFSTMYGPPEGIFILAFSDGAMAGGVGLRKFENDICEMKRLFVYDDFKGMKIGKLMCVELIGQSRERGYQSMRLDTFETMHSARRLYGSLGFKEIDAYRYNPDPDTIYMELDLSAENE